MSTVKSLERSLNGNVETEKDLCSWSSKLGGWINQTDERTEDICLSASCYENEYSDMSKLLVCSMRPYSPELSQVIVDGTPIVLGPELAALPALLSLDQSLRPSPQICRRAPVMIIEGLSDPATRERSLASDLYWKIRKADASRRRGVLDDAGQATFVGLCAPYWKMFNLSQGNPLYTATRVSDVAGNSVVSGVECTRIELHCSARDLEYLKNCSEGHKYGWSPSINKARLDMLRYINEKRLLKLVGDDIFTREFPDNFSMVQKILVHNYFNVAESNGKPLDVSSLRDTDVAKLVYNLNFIGTPGVSKTTKPIFDAFKMVNNRPGRQVGLYDALRASCGNKDVIVNFTYKIRNYYKSAKSDYEAFFKLCMHGYVNKDGSYKNLNNLRVAHLSESDAREQLKRQCEAYAHRLASIMTFGFNSEKNIDKINKVKEFLAMWKAGCEGSRGPSYYLTVKDYK